MKSRAKKLGEAHGVGWEGAAVRKSGAPAACAALCLGIIGFAGVFDWTCRVVDENDRYCAVCLCIIFVEIIHINFNVSGLYIKIKYYYIINYTSGGWFSADIP